MSVTLRVMSVYETNKKRYASELARARAELGRFEGALITRFGKEMADAIRHQTHWTEAMIFGRVEVPPLTKDGYAAVETLKAIRKKVTAVRRKIRSSDCWFCEPTTPIPVVETLGLFWDLVRQRCSEDGWLPVESVLWLLDADRTVPQAFPSDEQMYQWISEMHDDARAPWCWRRVLRRRRERLLRLLQAAVELEKEVRCRFS